MQCSNPFQIPNKIKKNRKYKPQHWQKYLTVPCGWCIGCRINKQQILIESGNYNFYKIYNATGSYLTLTYSPEQIIKNTIKGNDGNIRFSTRYKDGINFIKKVKEHCRRHKLEDEKNIYKKIKYIMATEYGEEKGRCHIHMLLFGLDHKICEPIYRQKWENGFIKILPIKKGGIRYVTDYLLSGTFGQTRKEWENITNCEAPKVKHSIGFCDEWIKANLKNITENRGIYKDENKTIPIPRYWLEKYNIIKCINNYTPTIEKMKTHNILNPTFEQIHEFRKEQSQIQLKNFIEKSRKNGNAQYNEWKQKNIKAQNDMEKLAWEAMDLDENGLPNWVPF